MQKTIVPCLIFVPCFIAFMLRILGSSIHIKPAAYYLCGVIWAVFILLSVWRYRKIYTRRDWPGLLFGTPVFWLLCTWSWAVCIACVSVQFQDYRRQTFQIVSFGEICRTERGVLRREWQLSHNNRTADWCSRDAQDFYEQGVRSGDIITLYGRENSLAWQIRPQIGKGMWKL